MAVAAGRRIAIATPGRTSEDPPGSRIPGRERPGADGPRAVRKVIFDPALLVVVALKEAVADVVVTDLAELELDGRARRRAYQREPGSGGSGVSHPERSTMGNRRPLTSSGTMRT